MRKIFMLLVLVSISYSQPARFFGTGYVQDSSFLIKKREILKSDTSILKHIQDETMICSSDSCYWDTMFKYDTTIRNYTRYSFEASYLICYSLFNSANRFYDITIDSAYSYYNGNFTELRIDTCWGDLNSNSVYNKYIRFIIKGFCGHPDYHNMDAIGIILTGSLKKSSDTIEGFVFADANFITFAPSTTAISQFRKMNRPPSFGMPSKQQYFLLNGKSIDRNNCILPAGLLVSNRKKIVSVSNKNNMVFNSRN